MTLAAGCKLGPYEISGPIGAGGMGEVYRAFDSRLGREVAIKVSAAQFTERFEREARAVAALNHPNICTLYDVGPNYLVMELIEGETLKGPLPLRTALDYARQIAQALEAAHEKGIVHRDLKPANIKIKPDGSVKVLDFGLAKITEPVSGSQNPASSPTLTLDGTRLGVILGTAAYMSPEQARGEPVDQRADIWAFGVVLYEMLAGERMFEARTVSDTLAAVLIKEPDLDRLPAQVRPVLRRCLAKEPKQRLHHIADVRLLLEDSTEAAPGVAVPLRSRLGAAAWIVAAVSVVVASALAFVHFREKPPVAEGVRFQIFPPEKSSFAGNDTKISPDGRRLVFQAPGPDGRIQLWVHSLDSVESKPLAGTEGVANGNFWSPDSRFLGFQVQGKLKKVDASGGPPQTLCDVPTSARGPNWVGGAWSRGGVIIFGPGTSGLWRVSERGGAPSEVTRLDPSRRDSFHANPAFLPDGRHFLYDRVGEVDRGIYLGSLDAKPEEQSSRKLLDNVASSAEYAPGSDPASASGYLLFARESSLMAQPFDLRRLALTGDAIPITDGFGTGGSRRFSVSMTGVLAYRGGPGSGDFALGITQLTWFDREGKPLGTAGERGGYNTVALSRDGSRVAVSRADPQNSTGLSGRPASDIWVHEFAGRTNKRLTFNPAVDLFATWSRDGSRIIFSSRRDGIFDLYEMVSSGAGNEELLFHSNEDKSAQDWSRDGRFLLYSVAPGGTSGNPNAAHDLWVLPLSPGEPGDRRPAVYLKTQFDENQAQFSPDGHFVAYRSDESGTNEIYVQPFPVDLGGKWTVSERGGSQPRWGRDGKELFFISADSKMMAAEVSTSPVFKVGLRKTLFQAPIFGGGSLRQATRYDVTADGKRFLINSVSADAGAPANQPITVVLNWTALLKK